MADRGESWAQRGDRRRAEEARRRRRRRIMSSTAVGVALAALAVVAYVWLMSGDDPDPVPAPAPDPAPRVEPPPVEPDDGDDPLVPATTPDAEPQPPSTAPTTTTAARPRGEGPVVWVQAGHAEPREPGYRDQSGAGTGPFGGEVAFTTRVAPLVIDRLRRAGVDARPMAGRVEPHRAPGAAFVSIHHDSPGGTVAFGHAITGAGENYYRGEGSGEPRPVPYPDSAPHRPATDVSARVEERSRDLARRISRRFAAVYTVANGAGGRFGGVQTREGNPRMMRYYGFYRTRADARVIVEAGAAGADDAFLARTDLVAAATARGIVDHLFARGLMRE